MNLSGRLYIKNYYYKDLGSDNSSTSFQYNSDFSKIFTWVRVPRQGTGLNSGIIIQRHNEDFEVIDNWELDNDIYAAQYVNGGSIIFMDKKTDRLFGIINIADSVTGVTSSNGFALRIVEYLIDYDNLSNSTVSILGITHIGDDNSQGINVISLNEMFINDSELIYSRNGGVDFWKWNWQTETIIYQKSFPGGVDYDSKKNDIIAGFISELNGNLYTNRYILYNYETEQLLHTASNVIEANIPGSQKRIIDEDKFEMWFMPRPSGVYGSEYELYRLYYAVFDKDMNLIKPIAMSNVSQNNYDPRGGQIILKNNNQTILVFGTAFRYYTINNLEQENINIPTVSGTTENIGGVLEQNSKDRLLVNLPSPHIVEIDTTLSGTSSNDQFQTTGMVGEYNVYYDDKQGTTGWITNLKDEETLTFPQSGIYELSIHSTEKILGFRFANTGDKDKLLKIKQWGNIDYSRNHSFNGCSNLTEVITNDGISNINGGDTFINCVSLHTFDVLEVIWAASQLNDTFTGCSSLSTVNFKSFKTHNITYMRNIFAGTPLTKIDASSWNTQNLASLVYGGICGNSNTTIEEIDVTGWDTRKLVNLQNAFQGCSNLILKGIKFWNTKSLQACVYAFQSVGKTNPNFESLDLSLWDMSNVTTVNRMFENTPAPNSDISNWDIRNMTDMVRFFAAVPPDVYTQCLINWSQLPLQSNVTLNMSASYYASAQSAKDYIIDTFGWTITDGGQI